MYYLKDLHKLQRKIEKTKCKLYDLRAEAHDLKAKLVMEVAEHMDQSEWRAEDSPPATLNDFWFSDWSCPRSPIKTCAYDNTPYSLDDLCIFCGNPYERK